jgi:hypothetical protein
MIDLRVEPPRIPVRNPLFLRGTQRTVTTRVWIVCLWGARFIP